MIDIYIYIYVKVRMRMRIRMMRMDDMMICILNERLLYSVGSKQANWGTRWRVESISVRQQNYSGHNSYGNRLSCHWLDWYFMLNTFWYIVNPFLFHCIRIRVQCSAEFNGTFTWHVRKHDIGECRFSEDGTYICHNFSTSHGCVSASDVGFYCLGEFENECGIDIALAIWDCAP